MADSYTARVVEVIPETDDAHSVVLEVPDTDSFRYKPGQFLTVAVPSERTGTVARCYSLSSAPHETDLLKITVKRTVEGYGSNWICDNVRQGHEIRVLPPSGIFTPADLDANFLLFAGGSGITPVISIAKSALALGSGEVVLLYANRDERSLIFGRELRELTEKHPDRFLVVHWLESVQGLPTPEHLRAFAEHFTSYDAFVCGPGPFMSGAVQALKDLGFPRERRHQEKFVSLGGTRSATRSRTSARRRTRRAPRKRRRVRRRRPSSGTSTARPSTSTTGQRASRSSTTCWTRACRRRSPAARASAAPVRAGCSRARSR